MRNDSWMAEMRLLLSIGDIMKRKVKNYLKENDLLPIVAFSSTEAATLDTGYSDPSKFNLDMVMLFKDDYFHMFQEDIDQQYVVNEQRIRAHSFSELPKFIEGKTLCGYDLEFAIKLININCYPDESIYGNTSPLDISKIITEREGGRYSLFNLAFWNNCEDLSRVGEVFQLHKVKIITDWFNGGKRNVVRKLRTDVRWIANLTYRMLKHNTLIIKNKGERHKIIIRMEEE